MEAHDLSLAIIAALYRRGLIDLSDITDIADEMDGLGGEDAAHLVRCVVLEQEAAANPPGPRLEVIQGGSDGGNSKA